MDTSSSSKTNERWMSSEELKGKIHSLKKKNQKATVAKLKRTQGKLAKLIEDRGEHTHSTQPHTRPKRLIEEISRACRLGGGGGGVGTLLIVL